MQDAFIKLDLEDESKRLTELTGVSEEVTYAFVVSEDNYCDIIGLNIYDDNDYVEESEIILDIEEMLTYISKKTGIDLDICYLLQEAEDKYYSEIGIIDPSDYVVSF